MPSSLEETLKRFEVDVPGEAVEPLERYCQLLWGWNERLNLTRHTDYERFVTRDVVDSLQLAGQLSAGEDVLDVGSGGGVPGVLLAILFPELNVELSESVGKRATALDDIVRQLGLPIPVHQARAEDLLDDLRFHALTARAVTSMDKMLTWFRGRWASFDRLLLIKGPRWVEERGEARHRGLMHELRLRKLASYATPGSGAENVILEIRHR